MRLGISILCVALTVGFVVAAPFEEAQVTRVVNQVDLLRPDRKPERATIGAEVRGRTAVRTGTDSRTELRFPDDTITRLGANALFRFQSGSRTIDLEQGTILFSPPKGAGGGEVRMGAVTAAVAGTTWLGSHIPDKEIKIVVLEGKVKVFWKGFLLGSKVLKAGDIFHLILTPPKPKAKISRLELEKLVQTSRLLESGGFDPLPKLELLQLAIRKQDVPPGHPYDPAIKDPQTAQIIRRAIWLNLPVFGNNKRPPVVPPRPNNPPPLTVVPNNQFQPPPTPPPKPPPTPPPTPPPYTPHVFAS